MPGKSRLNVAGTVAHIMGRSLSSEVMFNDDEDCAVFLSLFERYLECVNYRCYAWALMSNHYHLVVRTGDQDLWNLMKPLNTSYARYHKKRHKRDGPLFRDRFKSIVTQDQNYIEELVRYVRKSPVNPVFNSLSSSVCIYTPQRNRSRTMDLANENLVRAFKSSGLTQEAFCVRT